MGRLSYLIMSCPVLSCLVLSYLHTCQGRLSSFLSRAFLAFALLSMVTGAVLTCAFTFEISSGVHLQIGSVVHHSPRRSDLFRRKAFFGGVIEKACLARIIISSIGVLGAVSFFLIRHLFTVLPFAKPIRFFAIQAKRDLIGIVTPY